ncbi:hypothetical protein GQ53DRAFT_839090 [Thozetella sp. PMI_491]|nr:hypothetical protein GQ53DRAFT_839090 [Thozetella sp. PMI_491]
MNHLRFVNNGPKSLVFGLRGAYSNSGVWSCITLLLYTTTLGLQFTSTVLVSDLSTGPLAGSAQSNVTSVAMSFQNVNLTALRLVGQTPYFAVNPSSFPTFAEYQEDASMIGPGSDDVVRDTGLTYRAFIPFGDESARTSIQQYSGAATVLDARVVCVRPKVHSGLSMGYMSEDVGWILNGSLTPELTPPGLILPDEPAMTSGLVEMGFPLGANNTNDSFITLSWGQQLPCARDEGWAIGQKYLYFGPALVSSLDPRYPDIAANSTSSSNFTMKNPDYLAWNLTYYYGSDDIPLMTGQSYQLMNITAPLDLPALVNKTNSSDPINFYFSPDQDLNKLVITPQKEWLVFTIPRLPQWQVSVSLCFDSFFSIDANVSFITDTPTIYEPSLGAWNVTSRNFDTEAVRRQLGVALSSNETTFSDRGVFSLETTPQQLRNQVHAWYNHSKTNGWTNISFPTQNFIKPDLKAVFSWGTWMCTGCDMRFPNQSSNNISYQTNDLIQDQIFQDVIRTTANSALAWQTYFSVLGRLIYYEHMPYFDVHDASTVVWYRTFQFPRAQRGLIAVVVVLGAHIGIVGLVTIFFFWKTRMSRIGDNAWQTMTQFEAPVDITGILVASETLKDGDVRREIIKRGLKNKVVQLGN